jgi:hypothetical protein
LIFSKFFYIEKETNLAYSKQSEKKSSEAWQERENDEIYLKFCLKSASRSLESLGRPLFAYMNGVEVLIGSLMDLHKVL